MTRSSTTAGTAADLVDPNARKPAKRPTGSNGPLERVTVNLTMRSSQALEEVTVESGDTKTDVINRALQVYAFLERIRKNGGTFHVRETADAELERIAFL